MRHYCYAALVLCASAWGAEFQFPADGFPGDPYSYSHPDAGDFCVYVTVTDIEGDTSDRSNTVCKTTPSTFSWQAPTEYTNGMPIGAGELSFFTLTIEEALVRPGPILLGTVITTRETPPHIYALPTTQFNGSNFVDAGTWSVPGQNLDIRATIVRQAGMVSDARIISKATGTAEQDHDFMLSQINNGQMRFRLKTNGVTSTLIGATQVPLGVETEVRATYDGAAMRIFINGVEDATVAKTGNMDQTTKPVRVGMNPNGYGGWVGTIAIEVN